MFSGVSKTPVAPEGSVHYSENQVTLDLKLITDLNEPGGSVKFEITQYGEIVKILVINSEEDGFQAYENKCTHGEREIEYRSEDKILRCVSFGHSKYDLDGRVTEGPAPAPIKKFFVNHQDDNLIISLA
ncbi:MAG: hypothetical protein AMS27_06715 [Bacteroides sp. SM23_62_1]|nr:MAG: hypothetical protein AMS27_06715 [Bacteroides sp. SM23_62_1]